MERVAVGYFEGEFMRYKSVGEAAFRQLDPDQVSSENIGGSSVATIVWHVAGNLESRFTDFLHSDGEKDWRDRESEFASRSVSPTELQEKWDRGWGVLLEELGALEDSDLARIVTIRGNPLRVDEALLRSLAHASYHTGQIVYVAKALKGDDWNYLSIPPGRSAEYNANAPSEKGQDHSGRLRPSGADPPMRRATKVSPVLAVRDLGEALEYYRDKLGFTVAWTWGDPVSRGGVTLDDVEIQLEGLGQGAPPGPSVVYCHMIGVDSHYEACRDRGAIVTMELADRPWGMRDFRVVDPSGNRIGFASALKRASE
jgi:uncharacterized glyoxalase superfamily protein PhnB